MESISSLNEVLLQVLGSPGGQEVSSQELFDELTVNTAQLLKIFDFGGRSADELKEVQSGKVQVNGRSLAVNAEFAKQVVVVSQELNCSERFCSGLLHRVVSRNPNIGQEQAVELSILAYHQTRREVADCLRLIFEATVVTNQGYPSPIHVLLNDFARRNLLPIGAGKSLAQRIFTEVDKLADAITRARTAVTNAVSNTNLPTAAGSQPTLGHGILSARLQSLVVERRTLCIALFSIARAGDLTAAEIQEILEWLDRNPRSDVAYYLLATIFAAFDLSHSAPGTPGAHLRSSLFKDAAILSFTKRKLASTIEWKDNAMKAAIQLKWTLFLTEARHRDATLELRDGFKNEDLELQLLSAVQSDAFSYLSQVVTSMGEPRTTPTQLLERSMTGSAAESNDPKPIVTEEFKICLLHEIELLLRSLLTHAPAELRKIKHKQEDQFRPRADRHPRTPHHRDSHADRPPPQPRNDTLVLFQLIGLLYGYLPPDTAIQFWGGVPSTETPAYYELVEAERGKLSSFLRWAVEVRDPDLIIGVFDMLVGISNGQSCSECAYNFMASGTLDVVKGVSGRYEMATAFNWGGIFSELESWAALGSNQRGAHGAAPVQLPIAPKDILLGISFLKLLSTVVTYSVQARVAIFSHPQFRAISTLVSLIPLGAPLELKGAIFEALAAFSEPGAGVQGTEICKNIWTQMERLEVLNVRGTGLGSKGVEIELEEVESVYKVYPSTIPFLKLLSTLILTPKRIPLKNRVLEPVSLNTVPETLGQPYRQVGIGPYISFVVDNVLARLQRREFLDHTDSWRMADLALCFVERCLASYDLDSVPGLSNEFLSKGPQVLLPVLQHPGFDVMTRILSETSLRVSILTYAVEGAEELSKQQGKDDRFSRVLVRSLRILGRVLAIQDLFLDYLVPLLSEFDSASVIGRNITQSFLSRIDQSLTFNQRTIPAIAAYVMHPAHPELMYLAVKVLASLCQVPSFQNIGTLIERSPDSDMILDGFVRLLGVSVDQDIASAEEWADLWIGAGAPDEVAPENLMQAVRLAVLDLLLMGTRGNKATSLAFLLLFGKSSMDVQIQDPHALGARTLCLHVILQLVNEGVPRIDGKGKEIEFNSGARSMALFESQPVLAERLYKLIYQLCTNTRTSPAMMLYLRTREDFFVRHLSAMSFHVPQDDQPPPVELVYGDGSRVQSTCRTLKAFLHLRSSLLDLVALELHILTNKGQHQRVKILLDLLFGNTDSYQNGNSDWQNDLFRPFNDVSQSRIRIIELFQSLEFEWFDSISVSPIQLNFLKSLNLQTCVRVDAAGCEVVDRSALMQLLTSARQTLLSQGQIATTIQAQQLELETRYILESCVVENNRREVQFALTTSYESWKRLLDLVLTKCLGRIAHDQREGILFDLLHVLPASIRSPALSESSAVLLSEAFVLLITKLREERRQMLQFLSTQGREARILPVERMQGMLRAMLECILDGQRKELVRGNLYAALINYLHLIQSSNTPSPRVAENNGELSSSLALSFEESRELSPSLSLSSSVRGHRSQTLGCSLESASISLLKQVIDRLTMTISRDAIDGLQVWKTVAFILLDSLARVARTERQQFVSNSLDKHGILSSFVHALKEADIRMQAVLKPEPDDLNELYVFEAKMSFFIRLAQSRQGAERLLESRILSILAQIDVYDTLPESDESFNEQYTFLPSAIQRYYQFLNPTLQLVEEILATLGSNHAVAAKQALDFLSNHRDTFMILLKQEISRLSLASAQSLGLIISLCSTVVPSVQKNELLAANTGFGGLHNAILSFSAKVLGSSRWARAIVPVDESEALDAEARASGYGSHGSKFDAKRDRVTQDIWKSVVSYLGTASAFTEPEIVVVLSPVTSARIEDRSSGVIAPLPSLGDAINAINEFCDDLLSALKQIADISAELAHKDDIRTDNIEEIVGPLDADALRQLDAPQRRNFVSHVLDDTAAQARLAADGYLCTLEMLLLLVWRHITHYANDASLSATSNSLMNPNSILFGRSQLKSSTMRFLSMPDATLFQQETARALGRILEKLDSLDLSSDVSGRDWRSNQAYIGIMCRRLKDAISPDPSADADQES